MQRRIKRLPVLDAGRLVGIVKRMAQSGPDAMYVNVIVERGSVHLWGGVRSVAEQKAVRVAARVAQGTRKVEDHTFVMPPRLTGSFGPE